MGIPNEHQLKFNSIKNAKSLLQAVEKRIKPLVVPLQKLISQLEIHGESISQEDVNQKFLRSLSPEWNTHTIIKLQMAYANNEGKDILEGNNLEKEFSVNARECMAPRNQENRNRETTRTVVPVKTTTSNALVSCDGSGYDLSDQIEEGPTNFALMAYSFTSSNSEVSTGLNYSSSCLENVKILKEQNKQLLKDLRTSKLNVIAYKTDSFKRRVDKCKTGLGYNVVPPPYTGNFMPLKPDLSFSGLEEFVNEPIVSEPTVKKPVVETSEAKASKVKPKAVRKSNGAPIIEDWVSDN
ncbi:hypothetical protein Tco_0720213 [Tanacetum coccineum]